MISPDRAPAQRGRRPLLSAAQVIDAAEALLDEEGIDAVTFRRLSTELGVSHMTLYGYFGSKSELLEALVERTISVPSSRSARSDLWDEALLHALEDIHRSLVSRPGIAQLLVSRELTTDRGTHVREALLDILRDAGFSEHHATDGISILFNYVLGAALIEAQRNRGGSPQSFRVGLQYLITGLKSEPRSADP